MAEFTPINTQEELDSVISARIQREREKYKDYLSPDVVQERYKGYLSPDQEKEKYKDYLTPDQASELNKRIKKYETDSVKTRIAWEKGLPYEAASRLSGTTEDEIRADADNLANIFKPTKVQPLANTEPHDDEKKETDPERAAASGLLKQLTTKKER